MRAREVQNFKQGGDPYKKMKLGNYRNIFYQCHLIAQESDTFDDVTKIETDEKDINELYFSIISKRSTNLEYHQGELEYWTLYYNKNDNELILFFDNNGFDTTIFNTNDFKKITGA